jgi:signal transduction histidine kinase
LNCAGTIVFEPGVAGGEFRPSAQIPEVSKAAGLHFAPGGPLLRWLRVNNEPLNFRQNDGVVAYLAAEEREQLAVVGADICVPFVADDELTAFVLAWASTIRLDSKDSLEAFNDWTRQVAIRWSGLRAMEAAAAVRNAVERSHQLGTAGEMAASIAHEVRNPLAAIRSSIQFALDETLANVERSEILLNVLQDVDRIDRTATGLLQLSRPLPFSRARVRIDRLVLDAVEFLRPYASGRGVALFCDLAAEPLVVLSDERELWQAIINLLLNACQACTSGGQVYVHCTRCVGRDGIVEVLVRDSGAGISPEVLRRVFDPFFTTKTDGSGLGLPFCRQTIERHGGTISVDSIQGSGTLVRVQLPYVTADGSDSGR